MKVYEQVATLLAKQGVHTMFGLLGDANMFLVSAFEDAGGRFVRSAHEAGAVSMADGYARMTGSWAVATVTHGPGFTNALTALIEAARFTTPVLVITGDTPAEATHMQRLDIAAVCASIGVAHERVHRPDTVARDLGRAIRRLETTQAPVVFNVPVPISIVDNGTDDIALSVTPRRTPPVAQIDAEQLDTALGLAASATRPVIVAGRGAVGAEASLVDLADALGAGLFTTGLGIGLFADHPRHLGIMGGIAHDEATSSLMNSDCVIAVGTSLNKYTSHGGEILAGKSVIHVDDDPVKLGWFVEPTCGIVGDARAVAAAMAETIRHAGLPDKTSWKRQCEIASDAIRHWAPRDDRSTSDTIDIRVASQHLDATLPQGYAVVSDVGRFIAGSWPYLVNPGRGRFTAMTGFGAIGLGLAGGIGAAVGSDGGITVVLVGDGGFMMNASELSTAVREELPLLVVVYNDGAYGAEYQKLVNEGFSAQHSYNTWPDIAATAAGLGASVRTVRTPEDFVAVAAALHGLNGPLVVDVHLDPTHHLEF